MAHPDKQLKVKSESQGVESTAEQGEGSRTVCCTVMGVRLLSKKACPATQESHQYSHLVLGFRESQIEFAADLSTIRNQDGISDTMALEALGDDWLTFPMVHAVGISVAQ